MTIKLGSNIASLIAQRRLGETTRGLSTVFERLSSGLRINSASDDAAGLAIADSLKADARLSAQAYRNANDAISLLNIVSGAVGEQTEIVTRLSELAEQAANGALSDDQRGILNQEYQALVDEYGRIADSTEFNGIKVLRADRSDGLSTLLTQVGIDGSALSTLTFDMLDTALFGGTVGFTGDYTGDGDVDGLDFVQYNNFRGANQTFDDLAAFAGNSLLTEQIIDSNGQERTIYIAPVLFEVFGGNDVYYSVWTQVGDDEYEHLAGTQLDPDYVGDLNFTFSDTGATGSISVDFSNLEFERFQVGLTAGQDDPFEIEKTEIAFTGIESVNRALDALLTTENLREVLSLAQGRLGAMQSRLQIASQTLLSNQENYLAAESRIRDADIATESAELIRLQILQQSTAAVLAQANQQTSLVLNLLSSGE